MCLKFKVLNSMFKNIRLELIVKTPKRRQWRRSGVFIVNFDTFFTPFSSVSIFDFG